MTDRERQELAEVFAVVLDSRLESLRKELAEMVVMTIDAVINDLAAILESRNGQVSEKITEHLLRGRTQKEEDFLNRILG